MKTVFLFTVDVESRLSGDGPDRDVFGAIPGYAELFGIEKLMDLFDAYQARGTFFLNVYEIARHGEEAMARAARTIHARGHDLELHTHPRPMYTFYGMSQARLDEQVGILQRGKSLLEQWTGKKVIAHRAGAFSANSDTLRAAEAVGLLADSSLSSGSHVSVPLVDELGRTNSATRMGGVLEIPVTYYHQISFGPWHSRRILDIEASSLAEIKRVTRWAVRHQLPTVCILMHSFSLSRRGRPGKHVIRRLSALLAWLREQEDIEIDTMEGICQRLAMGPLPASTSIRAPSTGFWLTWCRAVQSWDDGWKNLATSGAGVACLVIIAIVLAWVGYGLF